MAFSCTILICGFFCLGRVMADTMLFNGAQASMFADAPEECLAAFNSSLACVPGVQLLGYDFDRLELTQGNLTSLCTPSCLSSLRDLDAAVSSACGSYDFDFNSGSLTAVQVVDLYLYKYNMSCLADSSGSFCMILEETWDVGALNSSGKATWPTYTNVTFPDFRAGTDGTPSTDVNGDLIDWSDPVPSFQSYNLSLPWAGQDYYQDGIAIDWEGHGWPVPLEYDEYPLEIQCSECFLAQYRLGIESQWGEVYDEVSDQVWNNMKLNCDIQWELVPAHNLSTWVVSSPPLLWTSTPTCEQAFEFNGTGSSGQDYTANDLALAYSVPSAAIVSLNQVAWNHAPAGNYCVPGSCQVAVLNGTMSAAAFVDLFDNLTTTQFASWNTYMDSQNLIVGEVVCIGPPGGAYTPVTGTLAIPSVYTTTAAPAAATPEGTIANCGLYYEVVSGDECNTIALASAITLDALLAMNPELDASCTNLLVGYDYCVALVNGTTATRTGTTTSTASPTPATTFVPAPAQTMTGTTSQCYEWYVAGSGASCVTIESKYNITLAYIRSLNPLVDAACDDILEGYAYCVDGIPVATVTTTSAATTPPSTFVPAPTQTVTGTTGECYEWYVVGSGDTCAAVEVEYNITLAYFRSLNTYVDAACDNIWADYAYCVDGVPQSTTTAATTTAAATAASSLVPAPAQTVAGTTGQCYEWYLVASGDTCATIESEYGITLAYFRSLNTYVDEECDNIWAGYAYCVEGVPDNSATTAW